MKEQYKNFMERIEPAISDEELFSSVVRRKDALASAGADGKRVNDMKIKSRKFLIPAVAGAVVLATSIGVGAAVYNRNFKDVYDTMTSPLSGWFVQQITDADGNAVEMTRHANFDYEKYTYNINKSFEFDDYTLNVYGAISDGEHTFISFDIDIGENIRLPDEQGKTTNLSAQVEGDEIWQSWGVGTHKILEGRTLTQVALIVNEPGDTSPINVHFKSFLVNPEEKYDPETNTYYSPGELYDLGVDISIPREELTLCPMMNIDVAEKPAIAFDRCTFDEPPYLGVWNLETLNISDLGFKIDFTNAEDYGPEKYPQYFMSNGVNLSLHFKDGTVMSLDSSYMGQGGAFDDEAARTMSIIKMFNYPIDLSEADYFEINDYRIPIN